MHIKLIVMALIKCSECGKEISDKATTCPHCGNPINSVPAQQNGETEEYLCCPKCGSRNLHADKKGFSGGKALVGAVAVGGLGLLAGTIGSKDMIITCLKCGKKFKAGEAKVWYSNNNNEAFINEIKDLLLRGTKSKEFKLLHKAEEMFMSLPDATNEQWEKFVNDFGNEYRNSEELQAKGAEYAKQAPKGGCAAVIIIFIMFSSLLATFL